MVETLAPFAAYVIALGIAAAIPGPGLVALIGRALGAGTGSTLPFVLGLALGDVLFLSVAVLGLSALAAAATGIFLFVKIGGGFYLLYLSWRLWSAKVEHTGTIRVAPQGPWAAALSGLAVTLGNPKTVVFYVALVPNVIDLAAVEPLDWLLLSMLTITTLLAVLLPYSVLASRLRKVLSSPNAVRRLNRGASALIGGAGALILHDAIAGQMQ